MAFCERKVARQLGYIKCPSVSPPTVPTNRQAKPDITPEGQIDWSLGFEISVNDKQNFISLSKIQHEFWGINMPVYRNTGWILPNSFLTVYGCNGFPFPQIPKHDMWHMRNTHTAALRLHRGRLHPPNLSCRIPAAGLSGPAVWSEPVSKWITDYFDSQFLISIHCLFRTFCWIHFFRKRFSKPAQSVDISKHFPSRIHSCLADKKVLGSGYPSVIGAQGFLSKGEQYWSEINIQLLYSSSFPVSINDSCFYTQQLFPYMTTS